MEFVTSLVKYDEKIGRLRFFLNAIALGFLACFVSVIVTLFIPKDITSSTQLTPETLPATLIMLLVGLVFTVLGCINNAKRFWDLTGDKQKGIYFSVGYFALCFVPIVNLIVSLVGFIFLLFVSGKAEDSAEKPVE